MESWNVSGWNFKAPPSSHGNFLLAQVFPTLSSLALESREFWQRLRDGRNTFLSWAEEIWPDPRNPAPNTSAHVQKFRKALVSTGAPSSHG